MKQDLTTSVKWGQGILPGLALGWLMALNGPAATLPLYVNDAVIDASTPPYSTPIDALAFLNNNTFSYSGSQLYQTYNTINYTNRGTMSGFPGYDFRTHPNPYGPSRMAGRFENTGTISVGQRITVEATNIYLRSTCSLPDSGLLQLTGHDVDASRSAIPMGFEVAGPGTESTVYWGIGTNRLNAGNLGAGPVITPLHDVTFTAGGTTPTSLLLPLPAAYVQDVTEDSNRVVRAVYVQNSSVGVSNKVYFADNEVVVEWSSIVVNPFTKETVTNFIYLRDDFGSTTNLAVVPTNGSPRTPVNYTFETATSPDGSLTAPAAASDPTGKFGTGTVSNEFAAFAVSFTASTVPVPALGGIPLMAGRVEMNAEHMLDLTRVRIATPNYLSLKATNHFVGAQGSQILSVYSDIDLGSTNGQLVITNLLLPTVPRLVGDVQLYSARWTTVTDGVTNDISILFADSSFQSGVPTLVKDLRLRSTNAVVISDEFNVLSNALIEARSLTLTAKNPGSYSTNGGALNFLNSSILWADALPSLRYLTNQGTLFTGNAVYYGSAANRYLALVNTGSIVNEGTLLWSDYFENRGLIDTGSGSLTATFDKAVLSNGTLQVSAGDIRLTGNSLVVANHELNAGRQLLFDVGNLLDDGGPGNDNQWSAGPYGGVALLRRPAAGDLLGSTINITLGDSEEAPIVWASKDVGCVPAGYVTNAALKKLVLDGDDFCLFTFSGAASSNALYVETLTLLNYATNVVGWLPSIEIVPGFKVYYAQAFAGTKDVSEQLAAQAALSANDNIYGRLCWVSNYVGAFSSTAIAYSPMETVVMNASLAASTHIDSDADGIVNAADPTPLYTASQVHLQLGLTSTAPLKPQLTWATLPGAQNTVLCKESWSQAGWLTLTNFVSASNTVSWVDQGASNSARMYRVQVNP